MIEVDIDPGSSIREQKPPRLRNRIAVRILVYQYDTSTKRSFQQNLERILGEAGFPFQFFQGQSVMTVSDFLQNTPFQHESGNLEDDGSPCDEFCLSLSFTGR